MKVNKYLIFILGALGGLLYGYDNGIISGALLYIPKDIPLHNSAMEGLVVSSMLFGAIVGAGGSGPLSDKIGRRRLVLFIALVFIVGSLVLAFSTNIAMLIIGRVIVGLAVGGSMSTVPVYLTEMAPTELRGSLGSLNQLMITIGILSAYLVNYAFADMGAWRWMLGLAVVPSLILLVGVAFMPESPRWLLENKSEKAARDVMKITYNPDAIDAEIKEMKEIASNSESTFSVIKSPWLRPTLIIGCIFAIFQQFIGINAVIFYAPTIFTKAGLGGSASIIGTVGIGVVNVLVTILALFIVDRVDRKKLLVIGNLGMIASLVIMAMLIWSIGIQSSAWVIIICLSLFIVFFGISWGPVLWVMLPELFPTRARGAATGIAALVLNFGTLIVAQLFPILNHHLDTEWVFLIFAAIGVLAMFFVIKYLPETRGRSLAEIEHELRLRTGVKSE
ncbi:SP family sugar:H+ symporter-like MFS transporter [Staphylococcus hominis]|uniref:glucose transporter GlcP n=1 Tax=Staphylococcus hominis TaxID=1290 RepID=UPI00160C79B1|nr:sugar porter family MFS transporter [Staphylococcus hominis]MBB4833442.1 SP family sugar:H+ symporter-like MFS transporter [Staphylococcus hominis]MCI2871917.1 sugar porter family MFS transporter [Staphylococcus hominis]MCI2876188.1 sugar porter family MFS transporter [Staphylococcus hominis]MCI2891294.1 sugar porter family MFS transporter [Staphylococcus hominis]MDS3868141.1 sugar porter family MFS transporter [Staphylococcus hominis]